MMPCPQEQKTRQGKFPDGHLTAFGRHVFSRYKTGETPPPVPLVKLLRILASHPELLPMVR